MFHKMSPRVPDSIPTGGNFFLLNLFCSSLHNSLLSTLPESPILEKTRLYVIMLMLCTNINGKAERSSSKGRQLKANENVKRKVFTLFIALCMHTSDSGKVNGPSCQFNILVQFSLVKFTIICKI